MKHFNGTLNFHFIGNKYEFASSLRLLFVKFVAWTVAKFQQGRRRLTTKKSSQEGEDVDDDDGYNGCRLYCSGRDIINILLNSNFVMFNNTKRMIAKNSQLIHWPTSWPIMCFCSVQQHKLVRWLRLWWLIKK